MTGFSLLEVMFAFIIVSISLLFFVKTEVTIWRNMTFLYQQNVALYQALGHRERLRMDRHSAQPFKQAAMWNKENKDLLPNGSGDFQQVGSYLLVDIHWGLKLEHHLAITLPK